MKIKIIIGVAVVVVIGILCAVFLPKMINSDKTENTTSTDEVLSEEAETTVYDIKDGRQILYVKNFDEANAVIKENKWKSEELESGFLYLVENAEIAGNKYNIYLTPSEENGELLKLSVDTFLFPEDYKKDDYAPKSHSGEEVKAEIRKFLDMIEKAYDVEIENRFTIASFDNEILDNEAAASYEAIWKGEAMFDFLLQDADGYYFSLQSGHSEEGATYLSFVKYLTESVYDGSYANVIVHNY